jgi:hypothetical protein
MYLLVVVYRSLPINTDPREARGKQLEVKF